MIARSCFANAPRTFFLCFLSWLACTSLQAQRDTLVPAGATWKYLDDGSDQGTAWTLQSFNDSSWAAGPAELGYGDNDEATVVNRGTPLSFVTTYFRHTFHSDSTTLMDGELKILRDDGAIVYLNGVEIARSNMPTGTVDYQTLAASTISGADEHVWHAYSLNALPLDSGDNVLAVEIHQRSTTSSDISIDVEFMRTFITYPIRGPYLQMATPNSMMVKWRTNRPSISELHYGLSPGNLNMTLTDSTYVTDHAFDLSGLTPNTQYYYALADTGGIFPDQDSSSTFITAPLPGTVQPIRIWALGDCGTGNSDARDVRDAYYNYVGNGKTDMLLFLGDNAYDSGTDAEYQNAIFQNMYETQLRKSVAWSCPGNHDTRSASSATQTGPYYDIFSFPTMGESGGLASGTEAYYSFDYGNIHFISLDSDDSDRSTTGPMMTWLQNDLASTTAQWIIAFWHHPPYTKGSHDSDNILDSSGRMWDMRKDFLPVLEAGGVDLVLTGHSHSYERTYLLHGHYGFSWDLTSAEIMDNGDGRLNGDGAYHKTSMGLDAGKGAVYLTAGSSGKTSTGLLNHPAHFSSLLELGSVVVEVDGKQLDLKFITDAGSTLDYFTLVKDSLVVGIQNPREGFAHLQASPNPSGTDVQVVLPAEREGPFTLKLINMKGETVREEVIAASEHLLSVRTLPAGIYLVEVTDHSLQDRFCARIMVR